LLTREKEVEWIARKWNNFQNSWPHNNRDWLKLSNRGSSRLQHTPSINFMNVHIFHQDSEYTDNHKNCSLIGPCEKTLSNSGRKKNLNCFPATTSKRAGVAPMKVALYIFLHVMV
jgi:hypothetical protein